MFEKKGILSDKDIKKSLGKDIFICDFNKDNLQGASYNLTASKYAYSIKDKKLIINSKNQLVFPPHETVIVLTKESIYVSENITGTYHSKVRIVSNGLTHISTTLDPGYFGVSAIAIHNNSDEEYILDSNKTFVTLILYRMESKAITTATNNPGSRPDIVDLTITEFKDNSLSPKFKSEYLQEMKNWFDKDYFNTQQGVINEFVKEHREENDKKREKIIKCLKWIGGVIVIPIIIAIITALIQK